SFEMARSPLPLRYPEKLAVGTILAVAILAGIALDALRRRDRIPRWAFAAAAGLAVCALALRVSPPSGGRLAAWLLEENPAAAALAAENLPTAFAEAGILWAVTLIGLDLVRSGGRPSIVCGLGLLTLVPVAANRRIAPVFLQEEVFAATPFDRFQNRMDPQGSFRAVGGSFYRAPSTLERERLGADPGGLDAAVRNWEVYSHLLWGRGTVLNVDFDHGDLSRLESLRGISLVASTYLDSGPFFGALGLRWAIRYAEQQSLGGYRHIRSLGIQEWDEHRRAYPDVRLLERWKEEPNALRAADALPKLTDGEVVLETEASRAGSAPAGRLRVLEKTPEKLVVEAEAQEPTWLFVLRGFWMYRRVRVDGRDVEPVPAQIAFSAVPIPAGRHRVEWEETLPGAQVSRWGPAVFVLAAAGLLARGRLAGERR
ncbi:MAG: hypothetical protein ACRD1B_08975, partial [Thermoanaerobaculia bacterium]